MSVEVPETPERTRPAAVAEEPELALHPGPTEYVKVAIVLAIATALEVGVYYLKLPHALLVALLLFFAIMKFSLVVLWFMHLRFDSPIFRRMFVLGLSVAITVYVIVLTIFGALHALFLVALVGLGVLIAVVALAIRARSTRASRK
jgi:cytochrome c oxidase subunit 4